MTVQGIMQNLEYVQSRRTNATGDSAPILPTAELFDAVGVVLDLSLENRDVLGAYDRLEESDQKPFLDIIASMLQQGVVGVETLEVRGEPQQVFATTRLGSEELRHARPYRGLAHIDLLV